MSNHTTHDEGLRDLAALCARLVRRLREVEPDDKLAMTAADYLSSKRYLNPLRIKPAGGRCTCAGPDGPCDNCIANREAYEEAQAEQRDAVRIDYGLSRYASLADAMDGAIREIAALRAALTTAKERS